MVEVRKIENRIYEKNKNNLNVFEVVGATTKKNGILKK